MSTAVLDLDEMLMLTIVPPNEADPNSGVANVKEGGRAGIHHLAAQLTQTDVSQRLAKDANFLKAADVNWQHSTGFNDHASPVHFYQCLEVQATGIRLVDIQGLLITVQQGSGAPLAITVPYPSTTARTTFNHHMQRGIFNPSTIAVIRAFIPVTIIAVKVITDPADCVKSIGGIDIHTGDVIDSDFHVNIKTMPYATDRTFHENGGNRARMEPYKAYIEFRSPHTSNKVHTVCSWTAVGATSARLQTAFEKAIHFFDTLIWPTVMEGEVLVDGHSEKMSKLFERARTEHHIDLASFKDLADHLQASHNQG